jgi:hypothetical protein
VNFLASPVSAADALGRCLTEAMLVYCSDREQRWAQCGPPAKRSERITPSTLYLPDMPIPEWLRGPVKYVRLSGPDPTGSVDHGSLPADPSGRFLHTLFLRVHLLQVKRMTNHQTLAMRLTIGQEVAFRTDRTDRYDNFFPIGRSEVGNLGKQLFEIIKDLPLLRQTASGIVHNFPNALATNGHGQQEHFEFSLE